MEIMIFAAGVFARGLRAFVHDSEDIKRYAPNVSALSKWLLAIIGLFVLIGAFGVGLDVALQQALTAMALWGAIEVGIYVYLQGVKKEGL